MSPRISDETRAQLLAGGYSPRTLDAIDARRAEPAPEPEPPCREYSVSVQLGSIMTQVFADDENAASEAATPQLRDMLEDALMEGTWYVELLGPAQRPEDAVTPAKGSGEHA